LETETTQPPCLFAESSAPPVRQRTMLSYFSLVSLMFRVGSSLQSGSRWLAQGAVVTQELLRHYNIGLDTPYDNLAQPTVAHLVLGVNESHRPAWAKTEDDVFVLVPQQACPVCPTSAKYPPTARLSEPQGWWCAQRHYMPGLHKLLLMFPEADYYFLSDADTMIFSSRLRAMLAHLEYGILGPSDDLYMGHGYGYEPQVPKFIMSGGGVLLRGRTLRRLKSSGRLRKCAKKHLQGDWCWHHLDWALAECLLEIGVQPVGHPSFQQFINMCPTCCNEKSIACHPVADKATLTDIESRRGRKLKFAASHSTEDTSKLIKEKLQLGDLLEQQQKLLQNSKFALNETWAKYCETYDWKSSYHSQCI